MPEHPFILKVLCAGLVGCLLLATGCLTIREHDQCSATRKPRWLSLD